MTQTRRPRRDRQTDNAGTALRGARRTTGERRPRRASTGPRALALVLALAVSGVLALAVGTLRSPAAENAGSSVYLSIGRQIWYGGASDVFTARMSVGGNPAYCSNPSKDTPREGYYERGELQTHGTDGERWSVESVEKVLFYGSGGPGFSADEWRSHIGGTDLEGRSFAQGLDWDGTQITEDEFYAYTHVLVSDRMWNDANAALDRTSREFREWFHWNILGYTYGHDGKIENPNAVGPSIEARELPGGFEAYQLNTGNNSMWQEGKPSQTVVCFEYTPSVTVTFSKVSANAALTDGNEEYAYSGATYEIFDTETDELVEAITTDERGEASCRLEPDHRYYAVETVAPAGFVRGEGRVEFATTSDDGAVSLVDEPGTLTLRIVKRDSATLGEAQPGATLQGAEFKVVDASGKAHLGRTDESGQVAFEGLPLGRVSVTETRAPAGYLPLEAAREYEVGAEDLPESGVVELEGDFLEDVIAFDLDLVKYRDTGVEGSGLQDPAEGVRFSIVSNTTGEEVGSVTTDESGRATTEGAWFGAGARPEGVSGAIPFDRAGYTVREDPSTTPAGYEPAPAWEIGPEQMADGVTLHYIVDNDFPASRIQVVKTDAQTGRNVELAGFSFQLLDAEKNPVTQEVWYPNHAELDTFTTDETGCVTFPGSLVPGTYYLREVGAQPPYLVAEKDVELVVGGEGESEPLTVVAFPDTQATGSATITKRCSAAPAGQAESAPDPGCTGSLAGAVYDVVATHDVMSPDGTVRAVAGEVMARVTTDTEGSATVSGLPLGAGSATYAFVEVESPMGHALDPTPHEFTLTYESDRTAVVSAEVEAGNEPTTVTLDKRVLGTGDAIAGVTFSVWEGSDDGPGDGEETLATTDESGTVTLAHLPAGTYHAREVSAPDGIVMDGTVMTFVVTEDGKVEGAPHHTIEIENDFTKVDLSKRDATTEEEVSGAHLTLLDAEGNVVNQWVSGEEPHRVEMLDPGLYTLVEEMTPHAYDLASAVEFVVADTGEVQAVVMYDQPIEVSGKIDKRQEVADPTAALTEADAQEADGGKNRAETSVSEDGRYDYSVDVRSTSSTWVDEFTVTDELSASRDGLAELLGITTPVASGDYDGLLNVWYRTNLSDGEDAVGSEANATLGDGHENPWLLHESNAEALGEDGRGLSYAGWMLWAEDVCATEATELATSDLDLEEGERVVAVRLEYGRVDAGFTTRARDWERDDLKHPHDDVPDVTPTHEGDVTEDGLERAPLVVHMRVTGECAEGTILENEARVDLFRNGGGEEGLEDHDSDHVEQSPVTLDEPGTLAKTGDAATPALGAAGLGAGLTLVGATLRRRR